MQGCQLVTISSMIGLEVLASAIKQEIKSVQIGKK